MKKMIGVIAVLLLAMTALTGAVTTETTTTAAAFNVASVVSFAVTLPSQSPVESSGAGAPTTGIEFNTTTGTTADVNARVVGGVAQSDGTPIFSISNDGTVPLNMTIAVAAGLPACMDLMGGATWATIATHITSTATVLNENFAPAAAAITYYLQTDFAACAAAASTSKTITLSGSTLMS